MARPRFDRAVEPRMESAAKIAPAGARSAFASSSSRRFARLERAHDGVPSDRAWRASPVARRFFRCVCDRPIASRTSAGVARASRRRESTPGSRRRCAGPRRPERPSPGFARPRPRRVERPAARGCLDDEHPVSRVRDDPVALEELRGERVRSGGYGESTAPPAAKMRSASSRLRGGKKRPCPPPSTPTVGAPASSAPSWAAASIPRASPETTQHPAAPRSRGEPAGEPSSVRALAARVPTIATHGCGQNPASPADHRPSRVGAKAPLAAERLDVDPATKAGYRRPIRAPSPPRKAPQGESPLVHGNIAAAMQRDLPTGAAPKEWEEF